MRRIDRAAAAYAPEREERDEFDISDEEIPFVSTKAKSSKTESKPATKAKPATDAKPAKSILKKASAVESDSEGESEGDFDDDDDGSESEAEEEEKPAKPIVSRAVRAKLEEDDDEIAALEKKLGMKGKKKNKVGDDELDWLVNGSDEETSARGASKRKRPEDDEWLQEKRRKAGLKAKPVKEVVESESEDSDNDGDDDEDMMDNPFSDDEVGSDDFDEFDSGDDDEPEPAQKKESTLR